MFVTSNMLVTEGKTNPILPRWPSWRSFGDLYRVYCGHYRNQLGPVIQELPGMGGFQGRIRVVPKPFMPRSLWQFLAAHAGGGAPNIVYPDTDVPELAIYWAGTGGAKMRMGLPLECTEVIKSYKYH